MSTNQDETEYRQFQVDLLNSRFKGTHTEAQMVDRLMKLCEKKNRFALEGLANAKLVCTPDSRMANSVWDKGAIYRMQSIASDPLQHP